MARVKLVDVASAAGVSVMTASYAFNQPQRVSAPTRERVLRAAEKLGYAGPDPRARSLRRGTTLTLGVVLGEQLSYAFDDPQAADFLAGVADACAERGYGMTILPITGGQGDVERVQQAAVDGFVVWTTTDDDPVLAALAKMRRPAVIHGGPAVAGFGYVGIDDAAAAYAVGRVAFDGARHPAVMSFPLDRARASIITSGTTIGSASFPITRERLSGFRRAAAACGRGWANVTVAVCSRNDRVEAEEVARRMLTMPNPPDAIAAMSDEQAAGAVSAARSLGHAVPGDMVVTGWDGSPTATTLGVPTIAQSLREQGGICARQVLDDSVTSVVGGWELVNPSPHERRAPGR